MGVVVDWNVAIVFGSLTLVLLGAFYFSFQGRREVAQAVRLVVERADLSDPRLAAELLHKLTAPPSDLRRGGMFMAVAIALAIMAVILDQPEALRPMLGVAAFPAMIGLAYMVFHAIGRRTPPGDGV